MGEGEKFHCSVGGAERIFLIYYITVIICYANISVYFIVDINLEMCQRTELQYF